MRKILTPPLVPVLVFVGACLFAVIANKLSPGMLDGHADNAPDRAAAMLPFATPLIYLFFVIINTLDLLIEKATPRIPWLSTLVVTLALTALFFDIFFRPGLDGATARTPVALGSLAGATILIVPMSYLRRRIGNKSRAEQGSEGTSSR